MPIRKNWGIGLKLTLLILVSVTLIFSLVFAYHYSFSRRMIVSNIERSAGNLAMATVNRIDLVLRPIEKVTQNLALFLERSSDYSSGEMIQLLRSHVENNPEIYGAAIAFEPYAYDENTASLAPYVHKAEDGTRFTYIPYEYFKWDWYRVPKELDRSVWCEPYYDEGAGNIIMTTYSVPFYRTDPENPGGKKFIGVVTGDVSLSWLQKMFSSIKIGKTGYGFLISKNGTYISHRASHLIMNETIFSVAEATDNSKLGDIGRAMIKGETGFVPVKNFANRECWMAYAPLPSNGWSLGVLFPRDELMADITRLNRDVIYLSILGFFLLLFVIVFIARSITGPLRLLSKATRDIAAGNLDFELPPIKSRDEVGHLAESFIYMKASLKKYIEDLTEATATKERIESELKVAHDIQMGILPKIFPPFPDRPEIDLFAILVPAKAVGGDLYDFFFMDDEHLCFAVGDVSDKGVPASLFMAITRTLIKIKASKGLTPDIVLNRVNEDLSMDNPSLMFVTLFLGILNVRTGELIYSNGGHNPPYLIHRADGKIMPLEPTNGMALGVKEDFHYQSKKIRLDKGEGIFLYTDGVTEARDGNKGLFSEKRLEETLAALKGKSVSEVITGVMKRVQDFSRDVSQSDDITMMFIKYNG